jgi:hypothetical protein
MKRVGLLTICVACMALVAVPANGARVRVGTLVLRADGGFTPQALPKHAYAPIDFKGHADIDTTDGSIPPVLQHVKLDFDRDGLLTTAGLGVCLPSRIEGATVEQARGRCGGAIVGTGHLGATISLPGGSHFDVRSPLTLFNGPRQAGNPTVLFHAQTSIPAFQAYVVVIPIERRSGTFGYRASFDVPAIAGGYGTLTHADVKVGRRYHSHGTERSYVSARCSDYILQTQGYFSFADGTIVYGSVFRTCRPLP